MKSKIKTISMESKIKRQYQMKSKIKSQHQTMKYNKNTISKISK